MSVPEGSRYQVKSGDSLWSIAHAHYGYGHAWPSIFAFNQLGTVKPHVHPRLLHPDELKIGQTIFLPRRLYVQHMRRSPGQRHIPRNVGRTRPAAGVAGATSAAAPAGSSSSGPGARIASSPLPGHNANGGEALVNKFGVKIDTSQHRKFRTEAQIGDWIVEVEFKGTMILRHDASVPVATFSRDNFEYTYKNEMLNAAGALTAVTKLGVDWQKKTGTAELMFTSNLITGNKAPLSLGVVMDDKGPALRAKVDYKGVHGKVHDILYFVQDDETLTVQVTVRWNPHLRPEPPPGVHVLIPATIPLTAPLAAPGPSPVPPMVPAPPVGAPIPQPAPAPRPPNIASSPMPTPHESESILLHAGKWAKDHPIAATAVGVAVVGLVIVALPEEAVAGAVAGAARIGQWLVLGGGATAAVSVAR